MQTEQQLKEKMVEIEGVNKLMSGKEFKMVELKEEIQKLRK